MTGKMMSIEQLAQAVQFNCDLSDRQFAADYSICIYLIRMREYYRWAHNIAADASLDQASLMDWVSDKEAAWESMGELDYRSLNFAGEQFSVFDSDALNDKLHPAGYTYSAGYGHFAKPVFMLAELESSEQTDHYRLTLAGRELARELTAPPAVMQDGHIMLRTESISRMIWDMYEEWQWHKPDNAMAEVVRYYDFERHPLAALVQASVDQRELLILHEVGEILAGECLPANWNEMVLAQDKPGQLFARGIRDCLADCLSTLPGLLDQEHTAAVHFYFASLTPMRKAMFPLLVAAYRHWRAEGVATHLNQAFQQGRKHWLEVANDLCTQFAAGQSRQDIALQGRIEQNAL